MKLGTTGGSTGIKLKRTATFNFQFSKHKSILNRNVHNIQHPYGEQFMLKLEANDRGWRV
jgi:hypothetical protein